MPERGGFSSWNEAEYSPDLGGHLHFSLTETESVCTWGVCVCVCVWHVCGMCVVGFVINGRLDFSSLLSYHLHQGVSVHRDD